MVFSDLSATNTSKALEHAALLSRLLRIVLLDEPLEVILERSLNELLDVSWLSLLPKGGVLLVDEPGASLKLVAEKNLGSQIKSLCSCVQFGHCLCGRAALHACTQHATCIDERHETRFENIAPHGHYNVPIISEQAVLGVLVVYLQHGHKRDDEEVAFLESFADILALVITTKQHKQAEETLARMGRILDNSSNEIYVFDAETLNFIQLNRGACENLGYSAEEVTALTPIDIKPEHTAESFTKLMQPLLRGETGMLSFETYHTRKNGSRYPVAINLHYAGDEHPPVFVAIVQDITERKENDARIETLAYYDSLTGLPNRTLMIDRLRQAVARAERHFHNVRLLFLDLNRFKEINDTRGHAVGDRVLSEVARRFRSVVGQSDTLARIGGDEFVVIAEDADYNQTIDMIERVEAELCAPVTIDGKSHSLGVSIGVATYPDSGDNPDALLRLADIAMYQAKASGCAYRFYDHEMGHLLSRQTEMADRLAVALAFDRLELHYQPFIDLKTNSLVGAEALLRWYEPDWGWIAPDEFIPIAEDRRMMADVGSWVVDKVCQQHLEWLEDGLLCPGRLAINVSVQQIEGDVLLESFQGALNRYGVPASAFEAEITESIMMKDPARAAETLRSLQRLGVNISIDDFGTGYSSLAYLKQFNTNKLKIDMSFVRDLMDDPNSQAIISATTSMAHNLGLTVLAEGVETQEQARRLRYLKCDQAQGYFFGKPEPAAEFARHWLRTAGNILQYRSSA